MKKIFYLVFLSLGLYTTSFSQPYCDEPQGSAGFPSDTTCQNAICAADAFCCDNTWDQLCADAAAVSDSCSGCLSPPSPPCTPGSLKLPPQPCPSVGTNTSESDAACVTGADAAAGNNNSGPNDPGFPGICPRDAIQVGDRLAGNINTYFDVVDSRDTDWFVVDLNGKDAVSVTLCADFDAAFFLISDPCSNFPIIEVDGSTDSGISSTIQIGVCSSVLMPCATTIFVATQAFSGVDCNSGNTGYTLTVSEICGPSVIPTMSEWALFLFGLVVFTVFTVGVYNRKKGILKNKI